MNAKQGCAEIVGWIIDGLTLAGAIAFYVVVYLCRAWIFDTALILCFGLLIGGGAVAIVATRRMRRWTKESQ